MADRSGVVTGNGLARLPAIRAHHTLPQDAASWAIDSCGGRVPYISSFLDVVTEPGDELRDPVAKIGLRAIAGQPLQQRGIRPGGGTSPGCIGM
jgi:hypothetical protein